MSTRVDWMDDTERGLIVKFFNVDPVQVVDPKSTRYLLGTSTFHNIVEFYAFEYKTHEKEFWDIVMPTVQCLPDQHMDIEMSKVDVGYFWLDYVTLVDIKYHVQFNELIMDIQHNNDPYMRFLVLVCNMMFVSDFREVSSKYKTVRTDTAWKDIIRRAHEYQQSLLHRII